MKYLEVEHILGINDGIYQESQKDDRVEYSGKDDYPIKMKKIEKLISMVPDDSLIDVATYYFKNLILLQPFANANHRTALLSSEYFLQLNDKKLEYTTEEIIEFHQKSFSVQFNVYNTYEEMDIRVLTEEKNDFYLYCKKFIEEHLT